jgi:Protein kinase domain
VSVPHSCCFTVEEPVTPPDNAVVRTLLMSLVPLLGITMLVITVFLLWRCYLASYTDTFQDQPLLVPPSPVDSKPVLSVQLLDLRAQGRFGSVYRAILTTTGETVAVKVLPLSERQSWLNERAFYSLQSISGHDNVLRFFGAEQHGSELWIVTEYLDRGSLYEYLKSSVVSWADLVTIATSLARGLAFLHGDVKHHAIAHRDIKSRNVLLKRNMTACIADFGLAVILDNNSSDVHAQVGVIFKSSANIYVIVIIVIIIN